MNKIYQISRNSVSNVRSHYQSHIKSRNNHLAKLFGNLSHDQIFETLYNKYLNQNENRLLTNMHDQVKFASRKISCLIAKHLKSYKHGQFIKECIVIAAKILLPEDQDKISRFKSLALSRNSVTRQINQHAKFLEDKLKNDIANYDKVTLIFDESNDNVNCAQVPIFIRCVDNDMNVHDRFLNLNQINKNCTGENFKDQLIKVQEKFEFDFNKVVSICTDSARSLVGKNIGAITLLKNHLSKNDNFTRNIQHFKCIIHQVNLCCKNIDFDHVVEKVTSTIN